MLEYEEKVLTSKVKDYMFKILEDYKVHDWAGGIAIKEVYRIVPLAELKFILKKETVLKIKRITTFQPISFDCMTPSYRLYVTDGKNEIECSALFNLLYKYKTGDDGSTHKLTKDDIKVKFANDSIFSLIVEIFSKKRQIPSAIECILGNY